MMFMNSKVYFYILFNVYKGMNINHIFPIRSFFPIFFLIKANTSKNIADY